MENLQFSRKTRECEASVSYCLKYGTGRSFLSFRLASASITETGELCAFQYIRCGKEFI